MDGCGQVSRPAFSPVGGSFRSARADLDVVYRLTGLDRAVIGFAPKRAGPSVSAVVAGY
jgi:hypothetical protein